VVATDTATVIVTSESSGATAAGIINHAVVPIMVIVGINHAATTGHAIVPITGHVTGSVLVITVMDAGMAVTVMVTLDITVTKAQLT